MVTAACGDDGGPDAAPVAPDTNSTTSTTTTTVAPDPVMEYVEPGPYPVGRRTAAIADESRGGRELPIEILYPAVDDGATFTDYELIAGLGYTSFTALDAPPVAAPPEGSAGFPLVAYSHGNNGFGWVHADLTEHLASHGFVVVAPDHVGNTIVDSFLGTSVDSEVAGADRPLDVSFAITATLDGLAEPLADVAAVVDRERIGVVGHSFGGFTALAVAGGAGTPDERVDAIVGLAPATEGLTDEQLAAVDVPTLLVSGTADVTTPVESNTERPFDLITGRPLRRVDIVDAGHMTFTDICRFVEILREIPEVGQDILDLADSYAVEACVPELIDVDVAQDIINHATTAFMLVEVAGDTDAASSISEPGVVQVAGDDAVYLTPG